MGISNGFRSLRKIALITPTLRPVGGTEIHVRTRIQTYLKHGIDVLVLTEDAPGSRTETTEVGTFQVECLGNSMFESLAPSRLLRQSNDMQRLADSIATECQAVDYSRIVPLDLINTLRGVVFQYMYVHTSEYTCPAGGRYLVRSRAVCEHGPGLACLARDQVEHCMTTLDGQRIPLRDRLRGLTRGAQTRYFARRLDAFIYNSEATRLQYHTHIGPVERNWVIPPPIAYSGTKPLEVSNRNPREILFVGRMAEIKGVMDVVEMMHHLPEEWTLTLLGDGPVRDQVQARLQTLGLQDRVHLGGWADRTTVQAANRRAAVAVVPSLWYEAWGMVGPEAMAEGCPVVAYDSGGIREWCHGPGTSLVAPRDVAGLASGVLSLADMPNDARAQMAERVRSLYGVDAYDAGWTSVLQFVDQHCGAARKSTASGVPE